MSTRTPGALLAISLMGIPLGAGEGAEAPDEGVPTAGVRLAELPLLPELRTVEQFSSHNREGQNGDARWHLYDDEHGDAVIFDVVGPGCVRSMWGTDIAEGAVFLFYFDGEAEPRFEIPMLDFYRGEHPLFPPPLVSYERRGNWGDRPFAGNSFVPIPFGHGLKISVRGHLEFYHILFERYPAGTPAATFTGTEDRSYLLECFTRSGDAPVEEPDATAGKVVVEADGLDPGHRLDLLRRGEPGCVRLLVIEGPATDRFIRDAWIEMRWDGHPLLDVRAPVGFFFGTAYRAAELRTLPLGSELLEGGRVRLSCFWPMPFWQGAEIALVNRSAARSGPLRAEMRVEPVDHYPEDRSGHFATLFRRGETSYGRDWLLAERPGAGWFVGAVQSMQHEHYCEGDEHISLDRAISPQIHGTGSEDYYLGCFWPNTAYSSPFANCVGDIQELGGGTFGGSYAIPSCYSRFHLEAPVPFYSHLDARIQHGGANTITSNYASLSFCYLRGQPRLVETDFIDVGNEESERAHGYQASESTARQVVARPEGEYRDCRHPETGRTHGAGVIRFRVALDPGNEGVRLRRRLDQASPRQTALVRINGRDVGTWYHPDHNETLRWYDSDFDVHPSFTRREPALDVELVVQTGAGRGAFTDFSYRVFSFLD